MARKYVNPNRQAPDTLPPSSSWDSGAPGGGLYDSRAPGAVLDQHKMTLSGLVQLLAGDPDRRIKFPMLDSHGRTAVMNALSERVPSEGGFLLAEELRSDVLIMSLASAIIRPLATVMPAGQWRSAVPVIEEGSHASGSPLGGFKFAWLAPGVSLTNTAPTLGRVAGEARKLAGYVTVPNELLADTSGLETFMREALPAGLAWAEDQAFISGSGVGEPEGLINAACAISVTRQTSSAVTLVDIAKMTSRMLPKSMSKFIWLCSPDVLAQLLELYFNFGAATSGIAATPSWLTWHPYTGQWLLLGRPLISNEFVSALGTAGDLVAVDPAFYVIFDRQIMQIETAAAGAGFGMDETEIKVTERVDGRIAVVSPVTPFNSSETVSPVVVLD